MTGAFQGDKKADSILFRRLLVRFAHLAKIRIGREDAEDLAQDAGATVVEKFRDTIRAEEFASWAFGILRNKIGNFLRRKARRGELTVDAFEIDFFTPLYEIKNLLANRTAILSCFPEFSFLS